MNWAFKFVINYLAKLKFLFIKTKECQKHLEVKLIKLGHSYSWFSCWRRTHAYQPSALMDLTQQNSILINLNSIVSSVHNCIQWDTESCFQEYWFYSDELRKLAPKANASTLRNWRLLILHILQAAENSNQIRFLLRIEQETF